MKLEFSRQILEKKAQISSFIKIQSMWTDGHDKANSRFSQFSEQRLKTRKSNIS
jgi:hypothetical protein